MAVSLSLSSLRCARQLLSRRSVFFSAFDPVDTTPSSSNVQRKNPPHSIASVAEAVKERRLPPELRGRADAIRSETDIVNVAERRVWRAIEEGDFENLPGKGKPLKILSNPHVDPAEDTLYRILAKNGCAPEWVEMNKEIRSLLKEWQSMVRKFLAKQARDDDPDWIMERDGLKEQLSYINKRILHYNLIVPFGRQMCGLKWEKELEELDKS